MEFTSETLLLYLVLGMYLFCYFLITWVWIKTDERNNYVCKSCGEFLNIKKYVVEGTYIPELDQFFLRETYRRHFHPYE